MLRLLMIVSGTFEALFGLSALIAPNLLIAGLGTETTAAAGLLARIFGAAALGLGAAALLARDEVNTKGGIAAAFGLALYNVLAACFILWTAAIDHSGGAALWGAGLIHAVRLRARESQGMKSLTIRDTGASRYPEPQTPVHAASGFRRSPE